MVNTAHVLMTIDRRRKIRRRIPLESSPPHNKPLDTLCTRPRIYIHTNCILHCGEKQPIPTYSAWQKQCITHDYTQTHRNAAQSQVVNKLNDYDGAQRKSHVISSHKHKHCNSTGRRRCVRRCNVIYTIRNTTNTPPTSTAQQQNSVHDCNAHRTHKQKHRTGKQQTQQRSYVYTIRNCASPLLLPYDNSKLSLTLHALNMSDKRTINNRDDRRTLMFMQNVQRTRSIICRNDAVNLQIRPRRYVRSHFEG